MSVASPSRAAFPGSQAGRHPRLHFRGLLRLHSNYGPLDRSTAQGGLCHRASIHPVTRINRLPATRSNRQLSGWFLPPLVIRAFWAHYDRTGSRCRAGRAVGRRARRLEYAPCHRPVGRSSISRRRRRPGLSSPCNRAPGASGPRGGRRAKPRLRDVGSAHFGYRSSSFSLPAPFWTRRIAPPRQA